MGRVQNDCFDMQIHIRVLQMDNSVFSRGFNLANMTCQLVKICSVITYIFLPVGMSNLQN